MIRNVVIHVTNEQPLLVDLPAMPTSSDASLVCTNVRMLDGKKPIFIDHSGSVFVFPYLHLRFIEIPVGAATGLPDLPAEARRLAGGDDSTTLDGPPDLESDLELDEAFLRRIRDA